MPIYTRPTNKVANKLSSQLCSKKFFSPYLSARKKNKYWEVLCESINTLTSIITSSIYLLLDLWYTNVFHFVPEIRFLCIFYFQMSHGVTFEKIPTNIWSLKILLPLNHYCSWTRARKLLDFFKFSQQYSQNKILYLTPHQFIEIQGVFSFQLVLFFFCSKFQFYIVMDDAKHLKVGLTSNTAWRSSNCCVGL